MLWLNLIVRLVLWAIAVHFGHWDGGDSGQYILEAQQAIHGFWGGYGTRVPLYMWFLATFSGGTIQLASIRAESVGIAIPLLAQTLMVYVSGIWIRRRFSPKLALFWLWDPLLLIYSNRVMCDALFACAVLAMAITFLDLIEGRVRSGIAFGFALACVLLGRSNGGPFVYFSIPFLAAAIWLARTRIKPRVVVTAIAVMFLCIAPRLVWNHQQQGKWFLADQGAEWFKTVAAVVELRDKNLSFSEAEHEWFTIHPHATPAEAVQSIAHNLGPYLFMTAKGMARVLFGHVNVEWFAIFTGRAISGPSWFKVNEAAMGSPLTGFAMLPWILGVLFVALWCAWVYFSAIRGAANAAARAVREKPALVAFFIWCILGALLMAFFPQVFGDSRFRCGVWPLMLVLWGAASAQAYKQSL